MPSQNKAEREGEGSREIYVRYLISREREIEREEERERERKREKRERGNDRGGFVRSQCESLEKRFSLPF